MDTLLEELDILTGRIVSIPLVGTIVLDAQGQPASPRPVVEEKVDKRPSCDWPVKVQDSEQPCGSEERLYHVTGKNVSRYVCERHFEGKAWGIWEIDAAKRCTY